MTPEEIRHHASEILTSHTKGIEYLSVSEHLEGLELSEAEHDAACEAIDNAIRAAIVIVHWQEG